MDSNAADPSPVVCPNLENRQPTCRRRVTLVNRFTCQLLELVEHKTNNLMLALLQGNIMSNHTKRIGNDGNELNRKASGLPRSSLLVLRTIFMQMKTTKMTNIVKQNGPRKVSAAYKSETSNFSNIISNSICAVLIASEHAQIFEWNSRKKRAK